MATSVSGMSDWGMDEDVVCRLVCDARLSELWWAWLPEAMFVSRAHQKVG
jgi:hypothetical protein